ncbi:MAG TPA: hypothetical protein VFX86_04150 [Candidatus Saccharimonadales bacterium]|nr:hypothetical protein [Candidatus Saccharimonadales bacterium]
MATKTPVDPEEGIHGEEEVRPRYGPGSSDYSGEKGGVYDSPGSPGGAKSASPGALGQAEQTGGVGSRGGVGEAESGLSDRLGKGFTGSIAGAAATASGNPAARLLRLIGRNKAKSAGVGGGIGALFITGLLFFLSVFPLKIEHIIKNITSRWTSSAQNAIEDTGENMLEHYIIKRVLPGYKSCGSTISKDCFARREGGGNPVTVVYNAWRDAKLETQLAEKYGIEFKWDSQSNTYYLKSRYIPGIGDDIGPNGERLGETWRRLDRTDFRRELRSAIRSETRWFNMMLRYKAGRLVEKKYGVVRCLLFCGTRDQLRDFKEDKKRAAKIYVNQRVIMPRNEALGIVLACLFDPLCRPHEVEVGDSSDPDHGAPKSDTEREIESTLARLAQNYGIVDEALIAKMIKDYDTISERGYTKYLIEKIFIRLGFQGAGRAAADAVPIVGWIVAGSDIISALHGAGPKLKKLTYVLNSTAAVGMFATYQTYADEIHTGNVDAEEVGSWNESLSSGNRGNPNDPIVGGTAGAEESPLYGQLIGNTPEANKISMQNLLSPSVFAQDGGNGGENSPAEEEHPYLCEDGETTPTAPLHTCPEERLGQGIKVLDLLNDFFSTPGVNVITEAANVISDLVGGLINAIVSPVVDVLTLIPGVDSATEWVGGVFNTFFTKIITELVPNPFGTNMGGGRNAHMIFAGGNVYGNDFTHHGIGGRKAEPRESAQAIIERHNRDMAEFESKPFFARMFDTDTPYSLTSRLAMTMPFDTSKIPQAGLANILRGPLSVFSSAFNLFGGAEVSAATLPLQPDPFGVTQYVYPRGSVPADPEKAWDNNNCSDKSESGPTHKWNEEAADGPVDENTGMPVNDRTNVCLLIEAATGSMGGLYDKNLLTEDEQSIFASSGGGTTGGAGGSSGGTVSGSAPELAQQLLELSRNGKIVFNDLWSDSDDGSAPIQNIQDTADSREAKTTSTCASEGRGTQAPNRTTPLSPKLLAFLIELAKDAPGIQVNSIAGQCHSSPNSEHWKGHAVDLECNGAPSKSVIDRAGQPHGVTNNGEVCPGDYHFHYSTTGG